MANEILMATRNLLNLAKTVLLLQTRFTSGSTSDLRFEILDNLRWDSRNGR